MIFKDPVIKLQKKSIRAITFSHYLESTDPLFKKLNILKWKELVTKRISLLMFKLHIGILSLPIETLFIRNATQPNYNTRQSADLFSFHGIQIWNHI